MIALGFHAVRLEPGELATDYFLLTIAALLDLRRQAGRTARTLRRVVRLVLLALIAAASIAGLVFIAIGD